MKYIRTTNGIFELIWDIIEKDGKQFIIEKYDGVTYEEEIVKQADTIKELIDELVIYNPNINEKLDRQRFIYQNKWEGLLNPKMAYFQKQNNIKVYGCIWVQLSNKAWRLEPVAVVNDKGELELL